MSNKYNAELLLTQHYATPIRFYLHRRNLDLSNIKTNFHNRISGIDNVGKNELIHKEDILFTFPVSELKIVEPYHEILKSVEDLRLKRETESALTHCIDDNKLHTLLRSEIDFVTRRGHVLQGILEAFDKEHLFIQTEKEIILVYRKGLLGLKEDVVACLNYPNQLEELRTKRKKWVEVNRENNFEDGIKHLLTELYPDNAHFIYELLQNAEDAGASAVQFILDSDRVTFEHNGDRLFSLNDVEAITSIGFSTKKDDQPNIGKFGIGFKAVYAYTATPEIESGEFHFCIRDMIIPDTSNLFQASLGEEKTRFIFPFDNPKKPAEKACAEIEQNLQQLNHGTLLFLSNIRKIEFQLPNSTTGILELTKNKNNDHKIEITVKRPAVHAPVSIRYLRFEKVVSVIDEDKKQKECKIAVAFGMAKEDKGEWKVKSLNPGQVFIYFPAANETSNLKFHLHAPFASTVARDSVRESPANDELRNHIADLIAESMTTIRDRGMLDVEFLATLPNDKEHIPTFYQPILKRIVEEFNTKKLVPMKQRSHAIASESYRTARGERILSDLINDQDLAILLERDKSSLLWIANPPQINQREDNFLSMLDISEWTIEDLIKFLETQSDTVIEWLKQKDDEWHQNLYAFLEDSDYESELSEIPIVRCDNGIYRVGCECYFSKDELQHDEDLFTHSAVGNEETRIESDEEDNQDQNFYYVSHAVYSSGNNKNQQQKARKFLETIGVKDVDDTERIKAILKQRYVYGTIELRELHHKRDLEKFIELVKKEPYRASLFKNYYIFEQERDGERTWWYPNKAYLDTPYINTGLKTYHEILDKDSENRKLALSPRYEEFGINLENLIEFAIAVGVQTKLEAVKQDIPHNHPERMYLIDQAEGRWMYKTGENEDYFIPEFRNLYIDPSIEKSKLIWRTLCSLPERCLQARYWNNNKDKEKGRPPRKSSLVHNLKEAKWVPQKDGDTISFVRPCDASRDHLPKEGFQWPKGFPEDAGDVWLKVIEFGKKAIEQREKYEQRDQQARKEGYNSMDEKEKSIELAQLLRQKGKLIEDVIFEYNSQNSESNPDFPTSTVKNPEHRGKQVLEQIRNAPKKEYEERIRSERSTKSEIEQRKTLEEWYTNYDSDKEEMVCQICKEEMPFKKNDHKYYFVAMEALTIKFKSDELPEFHFPKEFVAQYLALCPECAARYDYFVRSVKEGEKVMEELRNHLINSEDMEFSFELGELKTSIRFVETHFHDLKKVLRYYENPDKIKDSTD